MEYERIEGFALFDDRYSKFCVPTKTTGYINNIFYYKVLLALFECVLEVKILAGRLIVSFLYCVFVSVQNDFDVCLGDVADTVYSWKIN